MRSRALLVDANILRRDVLETRVLEVTAAEARERSGHWDPEDWPILVAALALRCERNHSQFHVLVGGHQLPLRVAY
jgi:hypothetical protein